jgi:hypothetical protein
MVNAPTRRVVTRQGVLVGRKCDVVTAPALARHSVTHLFMLASEVCDRHRGVTL